VKEKGGSIATLPHERWKEVRTSDERGKAPEHQGALWGIMEDKL